MIDKQTAVQLLDSAAKYAQGEFRKVFSEAEIVELYNCVCNSADHGLGFGQESLGWTDEEFDTAYKKRYLLAEKLLNYWENDKP